MIKKFCDNCEQEIVDKDFSFEAMMREIKYPAAFLAKMLPNKQEPKPQLIEKNIHLCKKCYDSKVAIK